MKKLLFTSLLLGLFVGAFGKGFEEFDFPRLDFACDEDFLSLVGTMKICINK